MFVGEFCPPGSGFEAFLTICVCKNCTNAVRSGKTSPETEPTRSKSSQTDRIRNHNACLMEVNMVKLERLRML
jgi:hypothetical protein